MPTSLLLVFSFCLSSGMPPLPTQYSIRRYLATPLLAPLPYRPYSFKHVAQLIGGLTSIQATMRNQLVTLNPSRTPGLDGVLSMSRASFIP
ncbi:hypothetical protein CPAR01_08778 [Colletotrichum paranaense]|uniref:Secreted protein n=4 Tax=Colletotrichum acutatum species complex TaxID=2707335 RepID=A0A9Q8WHK5_9PEZI|nr:uncharacterized protein CLUP02_08385 [Colletotrichum lupini]XP_060320812.1 uncharacterized protein CCOS01_01178 [Colletotrichum costaricense]XP_060349415.1 uncharacterized protein CPAR01_08778 [Colletotrichum paranaense]XP_060384835.1 uncharacterized protein CTAM01_04160 [Colletotrichum tamarilloi]KAK1503930.1 hypothetical protein CTAM01_04160 [Colletotrichum tamarilloi]KAK1538665.1 hypothetical protein CPAR01_08778 [Colletotrichum paranaense]KAK1539864.1 hypothetical protein CCOS01_01178 